jgi:hypothetical protein
MQPKITPTVVIDASSNCRMTSDATIQRSPATSHSHQKSATEAARSCGRDSELPSVAGPCCDVTAGPAMRAS